MSGGTDKRKSLTLAAVLVIVLAAVAVVALRQLLLQDAIRAAVEARLSATLGRHVSIGDLGLTLFPRIAVTGSDLRFGDDGVEAPALHIARVRIVPRVGSLFSRNVVIDEVRLDGFTVSILRAGGRWHVPPVVPSPSTSESSGALIERVRLVDGRIRVCDRALGGEITETASIDDLEAHLTGDSDVLRFSSITGRIGSAAIAGEAQADAAEVRLEFAADSIADEDLPTFLRLLGSDRPAFFHLRQAAAASVSLRVDRRANYLSGSGVLRAPEVLLEPLRLERFEAPFAIKGTRLEFRPTKFAFYEGAHDGMVAVALGATPAGWSSDSQVSGLDVGTFLAALTGRDQRFDGTGSVSGALRGRIGEPLDRSLLGRATIGVTDGVVRQFPLLGAINRALQLAEQEGADTRFRRLSATLTFVPGGATTDDLVLEAEDLRVEAAGRIGADRSLDLRGSASVSAERAASAVASIHELARLRNARGEIELPLAISGSLDAPNFTIDLKGGIRKGIADELRRRIRRFIR